MATVRLRLLSRLNPIKVYSYLKAILNETLTNIYKSLLTIQYGRNDNEKKNKKHSQQTITHYDSDITCPEISSDDEQAGHSANQS